MSTEKPERKTAVALRYKAPEDNAPRVTAKGHGAIAQKIIETAQKHNIPIRSDKDIVTVLAALELNEEIPPELYRAVAEILAFVYRLNRQALGTPTK